MFCFIGSSIISQLFVFVIRDIRQVFAKQGIFAALKVDISYNDDYAKLAMLTLSGYNVVTNVMFKPILIFLLLILSQYGVTNFQVSRYPCLI
jgi:hypothetical protein